MRGMEVYYLIQRVFFTKKKFINNNNDLGSSGWQVLLKLNGVYYAKSAAVVKTQLFFSGVTRASRSIDEDNLVFVKAVWHTWKCRSLKWDDDDLCLIGVLNK